MSLSITKYPKPIHLKNESKFSFYSNNAYKNITYAGIFLSLDDFDSSQTYFSLNLKNGVYIYFINKIDAIRNGEEYYIDNTMDNFSKFNILFDLFNDNEFISNNYNIIQINGNIQLQAKYKGSDYEITFENDSQQQGQFSETIFFDYTQRNMFSLEVGGYIKNKSAYLPIENRAIIPFADGTVYTNYNEILDSYLKSSFHWPYKADESLIITHLDTCRPYKVSAKDRYLTINEVFTSSENAESNLLYVLDGRLTNQKAAEFTAQNTSFYTEMLNKGFFLTSQAPVKNIFTNQPESLFWLNYTENTTINVIIHLYYIDGSDEIKELISNITVESYMVYEIISAYYILSQQVGLFTKEVEKYSIYIEDDSTVRISSIQTYIIKQKTGKEQFVKFKNSFGGYDCLVFSGETTINNEQSREFAENNNVILPYSLENKTKIVLNSGYMKKADYDYYLAALNSLELYLIEGDYIYPCVVKNKENISSKTDEYLYNLVLELEKSMREIEFTRISTEELPDVPGGIGYMKIQTNFVVS